MQSCRCLRAVRQSRVALGRPSQPGWLLYFRPPGFSPAAPGLFIGLVETEGRGCRMVPVSPGPCHRAPSTARAPKGDARGGAWLAGQLNLRPGAGGGRGGGSVGAGRRARPAPRAERLDLGAEQLGNASRLPGRGGPAERRSLSRFTAETSGGAAPPAVRRIRHRSSLPSRCLRRSGEP